MTEQPAAPQMPENPVLIKIAGGYAKWDEANQAIQLVEKPEQSTVFPKDVADKVIEALKANGVEETIEIVNVTINDTAETTENA